MATERFTTAPGKRRPVETPDFQVVCMVGYGQNMFPFNEGPNVVNKALLPVGNEPVINHVLNWVLESGVQDVLLLCPPSAFNALSVHIDEVYPPSRLRVILKKFTDGDKEEAEGDEQGEPSSFGMGMAMNIEEEGTCRLLRRFKSWIKTDFVLLPCDISPPPSLRLATLLDKHRSTPKAVMTSLFYEPSSAVKDGPEPILVALDKKSDELLHVQPLSGIEDDLELRMELMTTHPTLSLTTRLQDAHVYVFRRSVLDLMSTRRPKDLESLREQFVPWLIKGGWQRPLQEKWRPILSQSSRDPLHEALMRSTTTYTAPDPTSATSQSSPNAQASTMPSSPAHSSETSSDDDDDTYGGMSTSGRRRKVRAPFTWSCQVMVWKAPEPAPTPVGNLQQKKGKPVVPEVTEALLRANTIGSYWELNRNFLRVMPPVVQPPATPSRTPQTGLTATTAPTSVTPVPLISPTAQISPDSLLGVSTRVGERASIKKCVVGRHCVIGRGAKLVGCVLWDFVVVEENAKLENVILGSNSRVGDRAQLKDCELGTGYEAKPGAIMKGERLAAGQEA